MRRVQGIEIQDLRACPDSLRDAITDLLQFCINLGNHYAPAVPRLRSALERAETRRIIDLCSGGGGPWTRLCRSLAEASGDDPIEVVLTDKYPNRSALERARRIGSGVLDYHPEPVDARRVPEELTGFRTFFSSFHHFPPTEAREILESAVACKQGVAVFEATRRHALAIVSLCLAPLAAIVFTPFVRPFRWSRLLWTYLPPVLPCVALVDGVVSCLRTYTPAELLTLTEGLDEYVWEAGETFPAFSPVPVTYLIGYPRSPGGAT